MIRERIPKPVSKALQPSEPVRAKEAAQPILQAKASELNLNCLDLPLHAPEADSTKSTENKTGLPDNLKAGIESLSGISMDAVKVHRGSSQPAQMGALAFAQGREIHLGPGQEQHLPHEAWHIVQQAQGRVVPTGQLKSGVSLNDDSSLETEADVMGQRAAQAGSASGKLQGTIQAVTERPVSQLVRGDGVVQRRLFPIGQTPLTPTRQHWNEMIDFVEANTTRLDAVALNEYIASNEHNMWDEVFNTQVTALVNLRIKIEQAITAKKQPENDGATLGWDAIFPYLDRTLAAVGYVAVAQIAGLGGGHGEAGFRWKVTKRRDGAEIQMGSVPISAHGRTDLALNGARGAVKTAIIGHNEEVQYYFNLAHALNSS